MESSSDNEKRVASFIHQRLVKAYQGKLESTILKRLSDDVAQFLVSSMGNKIPKQTQWWEAVATRACELASMPFAPGQSRKRTHDDDDTEGTSATKKSKKKNPPTEAEVKAYLTALLARCTATEQVVWTREDAAAADLNDALEQALTHATQLRIGTTFTTSLLRGWFIVTQREILHKSWDVIGEALNSGAKDPSSSSATRRGVALFQLVQAGMHRLRYLEPKSQDISKLEKYKVVALQLLEKDDALRQSWTDAHDSPFTMTVTDAEGKVQEWIHPQWLCPKR